jgi:Zn-dependent protease
MMMRANIQLGKIFGIPIGLNVSWFLIFGLFTISLATGYFPAQNPDSSLMSNILLGAFASLLLFGSVLAHELGHSVIAIRNRIPVKQINLFIFGGVAQISQEPRTPGAEFRIAIAGPIISLALAGLFWGLSILDQSAPWIAAPSEYLARANLYLAAFNMLPGFPLDGGRVFRSLVWKLSGDFNRATSIASLVGQLIAFGMIGFGVVGAILGNITGGLWLAFIGWYLRNAAAATKQRTTLEQAMNGVTVEQVMSRDLYYVPNLISLRKLVDEYILGQGKNHFIVANVDRAMGYLSGNDIYKISRNKWPFITTEQAMISIDTLTSLSPDMELNEALRTIQDNELSSFPVVKDDKIVGALTREDVVKYIQLKLRFAS